MGGCRCTYKNCTLRTDGVTHMFHYPVFDKVRCHQWLTNAQKLEFLNLKVSQLKNRVVCQHHFKDDNFMNFLKDKLTFDAVPTEDGPYCDTSQISDKKSEQDDSKLYTISLEDIENEYLTFNDKKANFSVKYGDFLTNCDLMDLDSLNLTDNTQIVSKDRGYEENCDIILNDNIDRKKHVAANPILNKTLDTLPTKSDSVYTIHMTEVPVELDNMHANIMLPYVTAEPNVFQTTDQESTIKATYKPKQVSNKRTGKSLLKKKKITILDEQKISETVPLPDKLEPVCPSSILPLPKRKRNLNLNLADAVINNMQNNITKYVAPDLVEGSNIEQATNVAPSVGKEIIKIVNSSNKVENVKNIVQSNSEDVTENKKPSRHTSPPKTCSSVMNTANIKRSNNLLLKNRIPPERMAAIEEKRKFNMKLRDIVASCLDKLDDEEDTNCSTSKLKSKIEKNITQKVSSYLSKEPELPTVHDYTVAYLEARMKRMEDTLLNKIDQNSHRIMELRQSFSPSSNSKSVYTQTAVNEELRKKHLYQEISKYLRPETKSLIYEELFINQFVPKVSHSSPTKRRKVR